MPSTAEAIATLLNPRSVAVIGASEDPIKLSGIALRNLVAGGYRGRIYPINPKRSEIGGIPCFASPAALPAPADVAFMAIPADATPQAVRECGAAGIKVAILGSAGFAESGAEGAKLQAELVAAAAESGIRLVGPNCNGVYSATNRLALGFNTGHSKLMPAGDVAILSHSGALFDTMAAIMIRLGAGLSSFVSAGNEADFDVLDYLDHALDSADTRVVALLLDNLSDGARFRAQAARAQALGKPIVVLKIGMTEQGAAAAEAHCSRLASGGAAYRALFQACGVPVVSSLEALMTSAALLSRFGRRQGGIGALTVSGAGAALITDLADRYGVALTRYADHTQAALDSLKMFSTVGNPTDYGIFGAMRSAFDRVPGLIAEDPGVGAMLALVHSMNAYQRKPYIKALTGALPPGKPVLVLTPGGLPPDEREDYEANGFSCLADMGVALESLGALLSPAAPDLAVIEPGPRVLDLPAQPTEPESLALLRAVGIRTVETVECASLDEAAAAAGRLGYPVVLKGVVTGVAHKSEAGLVRTGIRDEAGLRAAWHAMGAPARTAVQPMIAGRLEAIAGLTRTPDLGLFLMAGLGGIHAEALQDVSMWPVPTGRARIEATLAETPLGRILTSARWSEPGTMAALLDALMALQAFALAAGDRLEAVDVNPLILGRAGCIAVDALVLPRQP